MENPCYKIVTDCDCPNHCRYIISYPTDCKCHSNKKVAKSRPLYPFSEFELVVDHFLSAQLFFLLHTLAAMVLALILIIAVASCVLIILPAIHNSLIHMLRHTHRAANPPQDLSVMKYNFECNIWILSVIHMFRWNTFNRKKNVKAK